jgi:hypothetical protein
MRRYNSLFGHFPLFASQLFNFAAAPVATPGADGGAPAGGGQPAGGGAPAPAGGGGQPGGAGGDGGRVDGLAQLRSAYDALKAEYEPFKALNVKPDQVSQFSTVYQKTFNEVAAIGRELGYPDDELVEALMENPVATLDYLRNEHQRAQQGQQRPDDGRDLNELIAERIEEAIAPINARENDRMTSEANAVFERTSWQLAADMYKAEGLDIANVPEDETSLLISAASEILKYDDDALKALKYQGKTAGIAKAFNEAKTLLDKYFVARSNRGNGAARPGAGAAAGANRGNGAFKPGFKDGKRATLDELIDNPGLVNEKYREL